MKFRAVALLILVSAGGAGWTRAMGQTTSDDTTIVERRGDLEFKLKVSPIPRVVGPIVTLTISVQNLGHSEVSVYVDPCQPDVKGIPPTENPYHIFAICAAAPYTETLAPGEEWNRYNPESLAIPPGRYSLQALVTLKPEVWLGLDFTLAEQQLSGCRSSWDRRPDARLKYLKEMVSSADPDHIATRRTLGIPRMPPHEVFLADRPKDCERAASALNRVRQEPGVPREVWLFDLGKHGYAVDDPKLDVGFADKLLYFFDPDFKYLTTYSGF